MTTRVMMMLGSYPFMLPTAAYQTLKRTSDYRWKQLDRLGRKPVQQFLGPGADQITLTGEILHHWNGGLYQVDAMRAEAATGAPLALLDGHAGLVMGQWVILKIDETKSELMDDGAARVISFLLTLKEYGEDQGGLGGFRSAISALSTLARLI